MSIGFAHRPVEILLVEDSPDDVELTQEALNEGNIRHHLNVVEDGVQALDFLRRKGRYVQAPEPDIVLLDLNLPRRSGQEVLMEVKSDVSLKHIPIMVLTTSAAGDDVFKSYQLHANCYITKPVDLGQFIRVLKVLQEFWLTVVELPSRQEDPK
ncbi:MAG TPA: response regulator [Candidatus Bathyarchaeia archaeon]